MSAPRRSNTNMSPKISRTRSASKGVAISTASGVTTAASGVGKVTAAPIGALEDQTWYHGLMPREDITKMLTTQGDWLVRRSEVKGEAKHVLSVFWAGKANHVVLHKTPDGKRHFITHEKDFASIQELVEFYKNLGKVLPGLAYVLANPIPRQDWELRHEWIVCEKKIGSGAFGEVFRGSLRLGNGEQLPVAIKRSHTTRQMTKAEITEIVAESRIMQKYKHANLVRLWGVAAETQPVMLVLELVAGGGLDGYLQKNPTATPMKIKFCLDAAKGTEYLHEMKCIHRDLACRNCLISDTKEVKISDFGLSIEGTTYTMKKTDKAPIKWLAPEIMAGPNYGKYTLRTDVWAFGVMMWEIMHNGEEPYPGMRVPEVAEKVKAGYRMPLEADPLVPQGVHGVIAATWVTDPDLRPTLVEIRMKLATLV